MLSPGSWSNPGRHRAAGFTLIEIVMVVTIMALFVSLAIPSLPDLTGAQIRKTARKVAMTMQWTRTKAVSLRRFYRVDVDIDTDAVSVSYYGPEGTFIEDETFRSFDTGSTGIVDVVTSKDGKVIEGEGHIHISPRGFTEPSLIHLRDEKGRDLTVAPSLTSGRVEILDGYTELAQE